MFHDSSQSGKALKIDCYLNLCDRLLWRSLDATGILRSSQQGLAAASQFEINSRRTEISQLSLRNYQSLWAPLAPALEHRAMTSHGGETFSVSVPRKISTSHAQNHIRSSVSTNSIRKTGHFSQPTGKLASFPVALRPIRRTQRTSSSAFSDLRQNGAPFGMIGCPILQKSGGADTLWLCQHSY